ncbi:MAG TPA: glycoside hydrolase family 20 zincin-like fold domain-containing protein, partial [Dyella sp.]|nr:glycoside hydrolase family 20 zincin-like fold domain-containing protein [Dyella sp.]
MTRRSLPRLALLAGVAWALAACAAAPVPPAAGAASTAPAEAPLSLIPQVARLVRAPGQFALRDGVPLVAAVGDRGAAAAARWLADAAQRSRALALPVAPAADATQPAVRFVRDASIAGDAAYRLVVAPDGVQVRARTDAGLFYGAVTLWQ